MSAAAFRRLSSGPSSSPLLLFDGLVLDPSGWEEHPGGQSVLRAWAGRDCTAAVRGQVSLHTETAELMMRTLAIARIQHDHQTDSALAAETDKRDWRDDEMKAEAD